MYMTLTVLSQTPSSLAVRIFHFFLECVQFAYCNIHDSIQTPDANGDILQTYTGITASPFVWQSNISARAYFTF